MRIYTYVYTYIHMCILVVVVVNFIKHQNRAITGERVAARAAPSLYIMYICIIHPRLLFIFFNNY